MLFVCAGIFAAPAELKYNRDIRPILSENCFPCHGFDEKSRKAKLRLDVAESAYHEMDNITPITPGSAEKSEVWLRISSKDEDETMPPPKSHRRPLNAEEQEKIKAWIGQGAKYEGHWAFIPPVRPEVPLVNEHTAANPIDAFIRERLKQEGLQPSPEADKYMLIRRVTLDLTGLPPTAAEVEAFVKDKDPRAYEKVVDRLLASPHYGERMALDWLDSSRYADSNGYSIDGGRHIWLWRDWVIDAFNHNLPYNEFLVKQLAGDLLTNHTEADLIATGFQRNNMVTHEGGTIPAENLLNYNADRVKTLGEAVLGLTLGCAQCHNHKFDPITQKDYYSMFAFFNSLGDAGLDGDGGVNPGPSIQARTVLRTGEEAGLRSRIAALKTSLERPDVKILRAWENREREMLAERGEGMQLLPLKVIKASTPNRIGALEVRDGDEVFIRKGGGFAAFDISAELPKTDRPITGLRVVVYPQPDLPGGGWGNGSFDAPAKSKPVAKAAAQAAGAKKKAAAKELAAKATDSGKAETKEPEVKAPETKGPEVKEPQPKDTEAKTPEIKVAEAKAPDAKAAEAKASEPKKPEAKAPESKDAKPKEEPEEKPPEPRGLFMLTAIAVTADTVPGDQINLFKLQTINRVTANDWDPKHPPAGCLDGRNLNGWSPERTVSGPVHLTATFEQPISVAATPFATVQLNFGFGREMMPGLVELLAVTGNDDDTDLPTEILGALQTPASERSAEMKERLWKYCAAHADETKRTRIELANLEERLSDLTNKFPTMVMNIAEKPRDTFIFNRGDYSQPTVKVEPATPAVLPPMPEGAPINRLGLAEWITMRTNPLTARVAVNRIWKQFFGIGIVGTAADFGSQGEWPSHPELLDWLAVEFMDSGWDVKHLVRAIVTSETYRQTSATSPELLDRDPLNRLLARGPRFRLPAESIRDGALEISGLLVPRIGGPSVNPYMPGDLWREVSHYGSTPATAQIFVQDHGEKLYRRSLYTFWKRTVPPPNMAAFDAPNREVCTVSRSTTTTPLQALVTLNDEQFVEASRAFADRMLSHSGGDSARLRWAFLEALSRPPDGTEQKVLEQALVRERKRYRANPSAALASVNVGESLRNSRLSPPEEAAWTQVATLILNLSETVTCN